MTRRRRLVAGAAIVAVFMLAGCGGDDEPSDTASKPPPKTNTGADRTEPSKPAPAPKTDTAAPKSTPSPGEAQPGGAGDEEPARSQALLTGSGGRIAPRVVHVPPYIAIRIELRSADGRTYELRFGRRRIRAGGQVSSASGSFPGLRPGKTLVGRPVAAGNAVRIEANAEPGP